MITDDLEKSAKPPYLFIGSEFSRRYLGIPTWEEFLAMFAKKNFALYKGKANGDLPVAAGHMAEDIFDEIFKNEAPHQLFIDRYEKEISENKENALKCLIADNLIKQVISKQDGLHENPELKILTQANIDGIITTNWDNAIEKIFPKFTTFIGQEELLFKSTFGIGEIYKIHGCATSPASLILTANDYGRFENRQSYIAAKLATIFVEHPVIFIGYSLSDKYLISVLAEIAHGLGNRRDKLSENLFFVRRQQKGESPHKTKTTMQIGEHTIPITLVVTDDFSSIYQSLARIERKIPAHVLRMLREQLYKVTESADPIKQVKIVDIDDDDSLDEIEFVAGFAVKQKFEESLSTVGIIGLNRDDIFHDFLYSNIDAQAIEIIKEAIPRLRKGRAHVPVFKYLRGAGINSQQEFIEAHINLGRPIPLQDSFINDDWYASNAKGKSAAQIIEEETDRPEFASKILLGLDFEQFSKDQVVIEKFALDNFERIRCGTYKSDIYKLICYLDVAKYSWYAPHTSNIHQ